MLFVDVSNVNGDVDWNAVAKAGIHGAFVKATEGATFDDWRFPLHRARAAKAGVHVGAYHFARPDHNDPITEARHFARIVGKLRAGELRPVLDFETPAHLSPEQMAAWARAWNHEVQRLLGVWPLFYSYPAFVAAMRPDRTIGAGFWLASYGVNDGREHWYSVPTPWKRIVAHQFTSNGHVPGIASRVDVSSVAKLQPLLAFPVRGSLVHLTHVIGGGRRRPV